MTITLPANPGVSPITSKKYQNPLVFTNDLKEYRRRADMTVQSISPIIESADIQARVAELAHDIARDFSRKRLFVLGVAEGGLPFMNDLARHLDAHTPTAAIRVESYRDTQSTGHPILKDPVPPGVQDHDVLLVDDIYDTGKTLACLVEALGDAGAKSVSICVLLTKQRSHEESVAIDYSGFDFPDAFAVGYGLDFNGEYRDLPFIGSLPVESL
jgi:hypoxanthine phosphoribosyltransferase